MTTITALRTVLERFPAGRPRGSWPADEYATAQRAQSRDAQVVMDLATDQFLVVTDATTRPLPHREVWQWAASPMSGPGRPPATSPAAPDATPST
jgi:hypothetical protein